MQACEQFAYIKKLLCKNGYPRKSFDEALARFWNQFYAPKTVSYNVEKCPLYICLTFTGKHCLDLRTRILKIVKLRYSQVSIRFGFKHSFCVRNMFRYKDRLPSALMSSVVYKFQCARCSSSYIGRTRRQFKVGVDEHLGISTRTNRILGAPAFSAVREHCTDCNHELLRDSFSVVSRAPSVYDLDIHEGLLIARDKPCLNTMGIQSCETILFA